MICQGNEVKAKIALLLARVEIRKHRLADVFCFFFSGCAACKRVEDGLAACVEVTAKQGMI